VRITRVLVGSLALAGLTGLWASEPDGEHADPGRVVREAVAKAKSIPAQAEALALLAWPDDAVADSQVSALARQQLVGFGDRGLQALQERLVAADIRFTADITSAIVETRLVVTAGLPPQYIPSLYDAVWFGSLDAKRLAMLELAEYRFPPAMLAFVDAAYEHPELTEIVIRSLKRLGDDRSRHYLGQLLLSGDPDYLDLAAEALAAIGGRGIEILRDATASPRPEIRGAVIDALVPVSGVDDLTILYEYVAQFPDDDSQRIDLVLQRAAQLESMLEARQELDAATQDEEF
jgi:hypothetical protein